MQNDDPGPKKDRNGHVIERIKEVARLKLLEVTKNGKVRIKVKAVNSKQFVEMFGNNSFRVVVSSKEPYQKVNYTIESVSSPYLTLKLSFTDPSTLSSTQSFDIIEIRTTKTLTVYTDFMIERIPENTVLEGFIPPQVSDSQINLIGSLEDSGEIAGYALLSGNVLLNLFLQVLSRRILCDIYQLWLLYRSGILSYLFGLLNDISSITLLSLMSINIPGLASVINNILMNFIYMDLLQTGLWIEYIVDLENPEDRSLCPTFALAGYTSMNSVSNLGSTFIFLFIITFLNVVLILTKLLNIFTCEKINVLGILETYLDNLLYWNFIFRFFIQQYQAIFIAASLNLYLGLQNFSLTLEKYESITSTAGDKMSTFSSLIMLPICAFLPFAMTLIIRSYQSEKQLKSSDYEKKFGTLTEGLRISERKNQNAKDLLSPYWNVFTLLRWAISIVIFVYLKDSPGLQVGLLYLLSLFMQSLLLHIKPIAWTGYHQIWAVPLEENYFKFVNEFLITCYLLLSVSLTDYNDYPDLRDNLGLLVLSTILLCVLANLIRALAISYLELSLMFKRKRYRDHLKLLERRRLDAIVEEEKKLQAEFESALTSTLGVQVKGVFVINKMGKRVPYKTKQTQGRSHLKNKQNKPIVNQDDLIIKEYKEFEFETDGKDQQYPTYENFIEVKQKEIEIRKKYEGIWKQSAIEEVKEKKYPSIIYEIRSNNRTAQLTPYQQSLKVIKPPAAAQDFSFNDNLEGTGSTLFNSKVEQVGRLKGINIKPKTNSIPRFKQRQQTTMMGGVKVNRIKFSNAQ
ncbi:hypothetical protein FGO68_gene11805 [Halteria grandinella]|uniref:TRP C-terminal domain-containing protein n=1 Tax=Halteria grandinella TaxID=5974 RepID=A0A8J8P4P9_HALGN|nr:hypothetical protein FGO68_gene11805 [Halteria grandinella]